MQEKALIQIAQCAEPTESAGEKNDASEITEQQIPQPSAPRVLAGKPDSDDEWGQSNPAKPALIKRRETKDAEHPAHSRAKPRPRFFKDRKHAAILQASNPKLQTPNKHRPPTFKKRAYSQFGICLELGIWGIWYLRRRVSLCVCGAVRVLDDGRDEARLSDREHRKRSLEKLRARRLPLCGR